MDSELLGRITINPDICHGKPTIRNKRYPVENMLELMASGMTRDEILSDYDDLEQADLDACLLFAADNCAMSRCERAAADWRCSLVLLSVHVK